MICEKQVNNFEIIYIHWALFVGGKKVNGSLSSENRNQKNAI